MFSFFHSLAIGIVSAVTAFTGAFHHAPQVLPTTTEQATSSIQISSIEGQDLPKKSASPKQENSTAIQNSNQPKVSEQTFTTPAGTIIDSKGKVIYTPPQTSTPTPTTQSQSTTSEAAPSTSSNVCKRTPTITATAKRQQDDTSLISASFTYSDGCTLASELKNAPLTLNYYLMSENYTGPNNSKQNFAQKAPVAIDNKTVRVGMTVVDSRPITLQNPALLSITVGSSVIGGKSTTAIVAIDPSANRLLKKFDCGNQVACFEWSK